MGFKISTHSRLRLVIVIKDNLVKERCRKPELEFLLLDDTGRINIYAYSKGDGT
jgi:hypothetical protein